MMQDFTEVLSSYSRGNKSALDKLVPTVYKELRKIAYKHMKSERQEHTLQATALVNEAYMKLADAELNLENRKHFFALASNIMRRILVDHARSRKSEKRGGGQGLVELEEWHAESVDSNFDIVEIDSLLKKLSEFDERAGKIFELSVFGGLKRLEIAELEGISVATVDRELRTSRAWITSRLKH
ncbi:ECF-type sigma factor [Pseudobacteriovorax antillogorgiicola]|uniref:RNA polymerase sigma factor, TIGR02999 family n=1 Tax=Pseudobacteriovorax antillogorgiicola TaxID=1513793 RepID=A0A1Y6CJV2_9BACT|nr:ECF-type sigma factor [Pseudobacteriovorax antillogorgiicola]TCS45920.1 RNA polymerase sigma factor (TIGR02999 family) [Pseudobacteriovorax antillogorgiicola]SMF71045.1 RNA polymerase sigma factor, TIGR02999 family [Pseudobacteriovorax antillogorgiicola]